jgi:hypothetical protein
MRTLASMTTAESSAPRLQDHMIGTYRSMRLGIAWIGIGLPLTLLIGGMWIDGGGLRGSMSAYYYSPSMRNIFVGALITIGVFLYLYKGFSTRENVALNAAGLFAVVVALLPTSPEVGPAASTAIYHRTMAVLFFLCIAYVAIACAGDTLSLIRDTNRASALQRQYRVLGALMIASPATVVAINLAGVDSATLHPTFWIEASGVWVFSAYWFVKSNELSQTNADELAAEGRLKKAVPKAKEMTAAPGQIVQVEPDVDRTSDLPEGEVATLARWRFDDMGSAVQAGALLVDDGVQETRVRAPE